MSSQSSASKVPPEGIDGLIRSIPVVESPTAAASASRSRRHSPSSTRKGTALGIAAREVDAVDDPGVGRVGDDHLVARVDGDEQRVQEALHPAAGDDDLPLRVERMPCPGGEERGDRLAEVDVAGEREPAVRLGRLEAPRRDADGLGRQREVGVEVLHAQHRPSGVRPCRLVRRGGDEVDPEASNRLEPLRPLDHGPSLMSPICRRG